MELIIGLQLSQNLNRLFTAEKKNCPLSIESLEESRLSWCSKDLTNPKKYGIIFIESEREVQSNDKVRT